MDLMDVGDIAAALSRYGDAYLRRVFTVGEIEDWNDSGSPGGLAACFAAKEATLKAIGAADRPIDLHFVEVRCDAGQPVVKLTRTCADIAARAAIVRVSVSVAVTDEIATAIAVAES
jgi:holo-[acyl-carrier protein] synthase